MKIGNVTHSVFFFFLSFLEQLFSHIRHTVDGFLDVTGANVPDVDKIPSVFQDTHIM